MKRHDFYIAENGKCGWYIAVDNTGMDYLHKDLQFHNGTGYIESGHLKHGKAPGYYLSKEIAEAYLQTYLMHREKNLMGIMSYYPLTETFKIVEEKHNMADQIEITVKVNGVETPLHRISEQTLLIVRENSKPREIPVARIGILRWCGNVEPRLFLNILGNINGHRDQVIVLDLNTGDIVSRWNLCVDGNRIKEYANIQVIS